MDKLSVIGKIGTILSDLKKQQEYFSNNLQTINEVEVELFAASANYLAEYAKVLKKFPVSRIATPMIPSDAAAKAVRQNDDDDIGFRLNIEEEELVADDKKIHQVAEELMRKDKPLAEGSPVGLRQDRGPQSPVMPQAQTEGSAVQTGSPQAPPKPAAATAPDVRSAFNAEEAMKSPAIPDDSPASPATHRPNPAAERTNAERAEQPPVSREPVAPIADIPGHRQPAAPMGEKPEEKPAETEKSPVTPGQHSAGSRFDRSPSEAASAPSGQPSVSRQETANPPAGPTPGSVTSTEKPESRQPEQPHPGPSNPASDSPRRPEAPVSSNEDRQAATAQAEQRKVSLNERFSEKKTTLYERIAPQPAQKESAGAPIANLGRSIGINERYYFIKTLFQDDKVAFDQAITRIDICHSLGEALEYTNKSLAGKYNWSRKEDDARKFYDLLKRRFV